MPTVTPKTAGPDMSSPKTQILAALRRASWISGQALADAAGISRAAIWKHIHALRREGYTIQASSGRGYRLEHAPDHLSPEGVHAGLQTELLGRNLICRRSIDSTQNLAKSLGRQGAPEGTAVLAENQTQGRGRRGRSWASIPHGVAVSLILRPKTSPDKAPHFPLLAGTALARAVSRVCGIWPGLKWPNDLLISGRKVIGILAELEAEMDRISAIYLGIGLNINAEAEDIPPDLASVATSLRIQAGRKIDRLDLVRALLEELEAAYYAYRLQGFGPIREAWKEHNITLGRQVRISSGREIITGTAVDINEDGALRVRTEEQELVTVSAGDVQLCPAV
ncbi:biotin--[acetyl-CoA-carboxylase] ligase [Desulfovermiculus halophilus]|uniref:biotin--[acetyl-CoA-carboxylase] ligase n=1 Tax=Desulfovermiculus halophilus TaxID=339722 RepID=UPI00068431BA|nr:biotin--[acetyl-CoA-carboxylase] ligase [Desulfovermiculus halophilus]